METMKAMILKDYNVFEKVQIPKPVIEKPDEILIKVLVCSICGTDKNVSSKPGTGKSKIGMVLGHEIVGEVAEIGPAVTTFKVGDRVVVNPNSYCGVCANCKAGYRNHCSNMELMGLSVQGGFAEYVKSYERMVFHISEKVPLNKAAFAEPLSCMLNGYSRLDITPGETCVVFGCGPIGVMFAQLAQRNGARVLAVEPNETRRAIAEKSGVKTLAPTPDLKDVLIAEWGRRANYCIDAAGGQLGEAINAAEFRGTILCFAAPRQITDANFSPIQSKELKIMGSFIINDSMHKAVTVLESDILNLDPLITHVLPLEEVGHGIELMKSGEGMEIILNVAERN